MHVLNILMSSRSKKWCLRACAHITAMCVKLNKFILSEVLAGQINDSIGYGHFLNSRSFFPKKGED